MSRIDFDQTGEDISPEHLAQAIGAKPSGSRGSFHCPGSGHENGDKKPSLSINRKNGRTVAKCHACGLSGTPIQVAGTIWGVSTDAAAERLAAQLGIVTSEAWPNGSGGLGELIQTYEYVDEEGEHLFEVCRYAHPKTFRQRVKQGSGWTWKLGDTRRVLYRLPQVVAGVNAGRLVMIPEGERDADELVQRGFVATCNSGGAGKWKREYSESLQGARVVIIADNDDSGHQHAQAVAQALHGVASEIRVLELPDLPKKGDVSDWFEAGGTDKEFKRLVGGCPIWEPSATVAAATEPHEWPEHPHLPRPPDPEPVPLDALPPVLRDMARTSHEATQAPLDSAIGAVLGGVSVAIVGKVRVEICPRRQWIKPAHEYIGIQQHSGTGKSPLINMVQKPIATWEARKAIEESPKRRWAEEQIKLAEKRVESARKDAVKDGNREDHLEHALNELTVAQRESHGEFQLLLSDATEIAEIHPVNFTRD